MDGGYLIMAEIIKLYEEVYDYGMCAKCGNDDMQFYLLMAQDSDDIIGVECVVCGVIGLFEEEDCIQLTIDSPKD